MRRGSLIRAVLAVGLLGVIGAVPASAEEPCPDGPVRRVLSSLLEPVLGARDCEEPEEPSRDPVIDPSPVDDVETEPRDGSTNTERPDTVAAPAGSAPSGDVRADVAPGRATTTRGPDARPGQPRLEPDPPVVLGPTVPTASATVPVSVAAALITGVIAGLTAAVAGRRRGRRAAFAQTGALLELIDDAVLLTDARGTVTFANATAATLLGERPCGRALRDVLAMSDARLDQVLAARAPVAFVTDLDATEPIPVHVAVSPVRARRPGAAVIALRDLREQRRLESLKTEILANVGHELRTPLTSALGFARLAATRELGPDKTKAFVAAIVDSCERLERVIDLLVDVATVEAGRVPTTVDRVRVGELVRERVARVEQRAPAHVFSLRTIGRTRALAANRALLAHAVDELLDNAIKFSPDGGLITISVTDAGEAVEIAVADQGIGIAAEHLDRLWEDFGQVDPSATRHFGGLGLGLSFVRRVAQAHDGAVAVESQPGSGSTFRMTVPVRAARGITTRPAPTRERPVPVS